MSYCAKTVQDKNVIKRFVQRRRLADALGVLKCTDTGFSSSVLDFGAGNGELSRTIIERYPQAKVVCYEPAPSLFVEAEHYLTGISNVTLAQDLEDIGGLQFEYIFCLEVFEHLPPQQAEQAVRRLNRLLKSGGTLVVGVPNEMSLPALIKGLFRMTRRYGAYDARPGNVLKATIGRPPKDRPVARIGPHLPYYPYHTGFDYRETERLLSRSFEPARKFGSPVDTIPSVLATEIYLIFKKPADSDGTGSPRPLSSNL